MKLPKDQLEPIMTNSENIKDCVLFPLTRKADAGGAQAAAEKAAEKVADAQTDFEPKV